MFGEFYQTGDPGLNFAPWPVVTREILPVTRETQNNSHWLAAWPYRGRTDADWR